MNALAIMLRTILLLLALVLVVMKAWPGQLLSTPLAQLTLGGLLGALVYMAIGLAVGIMLVAWMLHVPPKDRRDSEWSGAWIGSAFVLLIVVAFPFVYAASPKHTVVMDFANKVILTAIGWLI